VEENLFMDASVIVEKLAVLRGRDRQRECAHCGHALWEPPLPCPNCGAHSGETRWELFGAEVHQYRLNPCLSEAEVARFERSWGIVMPKEYRWFLMNVGNGGAGPGYGLFRLGCFGRASQKSCKIIAANLARPFPHTHVWNVAGWPKATDDPEVWRRFESAYFSDEHICGAMPIGDEGCGYFHLLVVSGPERGHIWIDGRVSDSGIAPILDSWNRKQSFLDWYRAWLDDSAGKLGGA
jgi:hypothetical protein